MEEHYNNKQPSTTQEHYSTTVSSEEKKEPPMGLVGVTALIIVLFGAWYGYQYLSGTMAAEEKMEKERAMIESVTAPSESLISEEQKQELIDRTTAPEAPLEDRDAINSATAPR